MDRYGGVGVGWGALFALAMVLLAVSPAAAADMCMLPGGVAVNGSIVGVLTETMESAPGQAAPGGTHSAMVAQ